MLFSFMKMGAGLLAVAGLTACGGDTTSPTLTAAGSYSATTFITTGPSGMTNQLLAGSTVNITLSTSGTTSGHLHLVASASNPAVDADLAGTWTQDGMTVHISAPAIDTFLNDMPFTLTANSASGWDLVGDQGFAGTRIQLTLKLLGSP
jgi:hypothetical protein